MYIHERKKYVQIIFTATKETLWLPKTTELQKNSKAFHEVLKRVIGPLENGSLPVLSSDR